MCICHDTKGYSMNDLSEQQEDFFSCEKEWQDMPEYVMEDLTPFRVINVRFRNEEDVKKFEESGYR